MALPYITNKSPVRNASNVIPSTLISFDILDPDSNLHLNTLRIYIKGDLAYDGYNFQSPYNGSNSIITTTTIDGYDGYHVSIDSNNNYANIVSVKIEVSDLTDSIDGYWGFTINNRVNTLYFSDGYGLKSIDIEDAVGECQSEVKTILSTSSIPNIPNNDIIYISGNIIDGYFCLATCFLERALGEGYGVRLICNEVEIETYADGYNTDKAQINDNGTLYLINKETNSIEVYYGVHYRNGGRSPDFLYNTSSVPNIVTGDILSLYVVSGESTKYSGGSRLYVGTTGGLTRVEAYDRQTDGYCDGYDAYGVSIHYGISGSGIQHEIIGGSVSSVTAISSDDDNDIMFVVTNDGYGNGGLTQISISQSRKIYYMTQSSGFIPSNNIKDIYGKGF